MSSAVAGAGRAAEAPDVAPEIAALLAEFAANAPSAPGIEELRAFHASVHERIFAEAGLPAPDIAGVRDHLVPVDGGEITVRVYTPRGEGPWPAFVHVHGGRWAVGTIDWPTVRHASAEVSAQVGCVVVDVEYRLAPEYRFPTAPEDCYAALVWTAAHAEELGIDPARIAIGGESAGGNIAAAVALMTRDRGGPELVLQLLEIPAPDLATMNAYPSADLFGSGYGLDRSLAEFVTRSYFENPDEARHPYASPILADDLSGLAPAYVMTAEFDLLRDSGEAYARRLTAAGVPVTVTRQPGHVHASPIFLITWEPTLRWLQERHAALDQAFRNTTTTEAQ